NKGELRVNFLKPMALATLAIAPLAAQSVNDTLNGIVSDSATSAKLAGVDVSCNGVSVKTQSDGSFALVVPAGDTRVRAFAAGPRIEWNAEKGFIAGPALGGAASLTLRAASGRVAADFASASGD